MIGGADFDGSVTPLRILLAAGALALVNGIFGLALIARERQVAALWLNVTALVFNVGLNLVLVPAYGIVAAAIVTVASEILILAGSYPLMRRYLGFFPSPGTLGAALVAAAAMAACSVARCATPRWPLTAPAGSAPCTARFSTRISPRAARSWRAPRLMRAPPPRIPRGPRDSRSWYLDADPLAQVDRRLVDFAAAHAGQRVLDLGCGLGGYSLALAERGREVRALDVSEEYVERARGARGGRRDLRRRAASRSRTGAWTR